MLPDLFPLEIKKKLHDKLFMIADDKVRRVVILEFFLKFYCEVFSEDPQDGSSFDCEVMDALNRIKDRIRNGASRYHG